MKKNNEVKIIVCPEGHTYPIDEKFWMYVQEHRRVNDSEFQYTCEKCGNHIDMDQKLGSTYV